MFNELPLRKSEIQHCWFSGLLPLASLLSFYARSNGQNNGQEKTAMRRQVSDESRVQKSTPEETP
jgi:stringent starvation protein B